MCEEKLNQELRELVILQRHHFVHVTGWGSLVAVPDKSNADASRTYIYPEG